VQPSNTATNALKLRKHTQPIPWDSKYDIVVFAMLLALQKGDYHWQAADIHNGWFEVLCQDRVQYANNRTKMA